VTVSDAGRDERMRAYEARMRALIVEHGWVVQGVFPVDAADVWLGYTVGMTAAGLPELVISGLGGEQLQAVLNLFAKRHVGQEIRAGDTVDGVVNVPVRAIAGLRAPISFARRMYGPVRADAVQLVWPDDAGLFPGEPGYAEAMRQELFGQVWW
jgi:hypothetical protein